MLLFLFLLIDESDGQLYFIMSKQINPYLDFVLGLDATQFDLLCDAINQRKDRERYGAISFEEAALNYGRKPICPKCLSDKYHADGSGKAV